jgi:hypothetical protein
MNPMKKHWLFLFAALGGMSCAPSEVKVEMNFPTTAAFMHSEQGRLRVFRLTQDDLGICPELLDGLATANFPARAELAFDSQLASACSFLQGAEVTGIGEGPHAYLAEMRSASNELILQGCRVGEIYVDAPDLRVELQPTNAYDAVRDMPVSGSPMSRCGVAP